MLVNQASEWATQQDTPVAPAIQMEGFFVCKHEAQGNADKPIQQFFTWVAGDRLHSQPITRFCLDARKIFQLHDMEKKRVAISGKICTWRETEIGDSISCIIRRVITCYRRQTLSMQSEWDSMAI